MVAVLIILSSAAVYAGAGFVVARPPGAGTLPSAMYSAGASINSTCSRSPQPRQIFVRRRAVGRRAARHAGAASGGMRRRSRTRLIAVAIAVAGCWSHSSMRAPCAFESLRGRSLARGVDGAARCRVRVSYDRHLAVRFIVLVGFGDFASSRACAASDLVAQSSSDGRFGRHCDTKICCSPPGGVYLPRRLSCPRITSPTGGLSPSFISSRVVVHVHLHLAEI
ncbi:MAG: hypothetical protein ACLT98_08595 [Eggerthellaceae bacterium]